MSILVATGGNGTKRRQIYRFRGHQLYEVTGPSLPVDEIEGEEAEPEAHVDECSPEPRLNILLHREGIAQRRPTALQKRSAVQGSTVKRYSFTIYF